MTPKWAWPGSSDPIWDPVITFKGIEQAASNFGERWMTDPYCLADHKTTPKWAWPGSRDLISKFLDPI